MKLSKSAKSLLALASLGLALAIAPANATPAGFAEGIRAYNARQYSQALAYFTQASKVEPSNPTIHYYMGLSYQGMNQMTLAKQQYEWVATTRASNPTLAAQARLALQNLSRYGSSRQTSSSPQPTASSAPMAIADTGPQLNGRLKILYFTTDW